LAWPASPPLDDRDVVTYRDADHPSEQADPGHPHRRERTQLALEDRDDD
jgi:hypothetical protein